MPRTSASRTAMNAWMWNFALKPLPMMPIPSGLLIVRHSELGECGRRAAFPFRHDRVADVLQVVDSDARGPETRQRQVAEGNEIARAFLECLRSFTRPGK